MLTILLAAVAGMAQGTQDFASKFMEGCDEDTAVQCVTVGPKMMEEIMRRPDTSRNEHIAQAIQKLKSARVITSATRGETYYRMAEDLLKKNPQRFSHAGDYRSGHAYGTFYTRKTASGDTVELIMLHTDTKAGSMVIVNLTGDIDEDFISSLTKSFSGAAAKA